MSLWVDPSPSETSGCVNGLADGTVVIELDEPLDGRRLYTHTISADDGVIERIETIANAIIAMSVSDATALVTDAGYEVRDLSATDANGDFNPNRINLETVNGIVEFASVG